MLPHGKLALIPGASRPVGRAIANKFGEMGATLLLPVFDWPESTEELAKEFRTAGFDFHIYPVDLRSCEEIQRYAALIGKNHGYVDYLVNNIERGGMPVVHGSYDLPHNHHQWDLEFDTTLRAKWMLYQHIAPLMKNRSGGSITNISSISAIIGRSGPAAVFFNDGYSAANRAVQVFTETWAREMGPELRVNELMLGLIQHRHGEGTRGWQLLSEQEKQALQQSILLRRSGYPKEVAQAVYFLAVEASYITGAVIRMDGGYTLGHAKVPPIPPGVLA